MIRNLHIAILLFISAVAFGQSKTDSITLKIAFKFGDKPFELHKNYVSKNDTLQIDKFKFYLSNINIHYSARTEITNMGSYLIDAENPETLNIAFGKSLADEIDEISFNIGVDSLTSVSGALSGDLDPVNGMYWSWQSGYINMKIEGKSNSCKTLKNEFEFHIGGYLKPNYAKRKVSLKTHNKTGFIVLTVDVADFFSNIDLVKTNSVMIPGKDAMKLADYSMKMFTVE